MSERRFFASAGQSCTGPEKQGYTAIVEEIIPDGVKIATRHYIYKLVTERLHQKR
jgi:hypothetical protein